MFQSLLFDDDAEARTQDLARTAALENARVETAARKAAWDSSNPFPEDMAKWAAAHRELINARCREAYRIAYPEAAPGYLHSSACYRAEKLGCKIGRRGPILRRYERARNQELIPCYWCKRLTEPDGRHLDHIQPLARGGEHSAGNLRIACIECNLSKGDLLPAEFRKRVEGRRLINSRILTEYHRTRCRTEPSS